METKECKMRNILANVGHGSTADLGHVAIGLAMVADAISELAGAMRGGGAKTQTETLDELARKAQWGLP